MQKQIILAAIAVATTASFATAQLGRKTYNVDLDPATAGNGIHLGCAYGKNNAFIYTSARGSGGSAGVAPHTVYVWDGAGALVNTLGQTAASDLTVWGYRDGASSNMGQVFFGWDGGIDVYDADVAGNLTPATTLLGSGGSTVLTPLAIGAPGTITGVGLTTHRAIAYNVHGNGGFGSFFVANFGGAISEIDAAGIVLNTFPNTSAIVWSAYGMALNDNGDTDETNDTLWINASPNAGKLVEYSIDRVADVMTPTGLEIERNQPGTAQGGLAFVAGGLDGRDCGYDLVGVDQGPIDTLTGYRVVQWEGYAPADEPQLLVGVDGGALGAGVAEVTSATASLELDVVSAGTAGLPHVLFVDFAGGVQRAPGPIVGVGDVVWELSHPRIDSVMAGAFPAGTPISYPNFLGVMPVGTEVEWQAFAIDTTAPASSCGYNLSFVGGPWSTTTFGGHLRVVDPLPCLTFEDFDTTPLGLGSYPATWSDGGGSRAWTNHTGTTTSGATGPSAGAFSGANYMYCETSGFTADTFIMRTRVFTAAELAGGQIAYQLSRIGATIGTMDVLMDDGINPAVLQISYTGAAPGDWVQEIVTLTSVPPGGASFLFSYTAGGSFTGDIAIDDFCTL